MYRMSYASKVLAEPTIIPTKPVIEIDEEFEYIINITRQMNNAIREIGYRAEKRYYQHLQEGRIDKHPYEWVLDKEEEYEIYSAKFEIDESESETSESEVDPYSDDDLYETF